MTDKVAVTVDNVSKDFQFSAKRASTLKSAFTSLFRKKGTEIGNTKQHALRNVSFDIKEGEFFGIVGRNGSGKSTLLKMIAGIYQPNKGKIHVHGKLVPFIELGVGFNPELTGRENVYLNGALLGFSEKEIDIFYDEVVQFAELEEFMDKKLKNYSSGMQVRLAFSMAVRAKADILLIDEVLAVGDADFQRKCFDYFKRLKKDKITVVFVSHDMEAVRQYCDRAILIEENRLLVSGTAKEVASSYTKLFTRNTELNDQKTKTWGDSSTAIKEPHITGDGPDIKLSFVVEAKTDIENAIYGFSLKDSQGLKIIGTNSRLNDDSSLTLKAGHKKKLTYRFKNVLNDGDYLIDLAILNEDGLGVKLWWEDATGITIKKNIRLPSILNYEIICTHQKV